MTYKYIPTFIKEVWSYWRERKILQKHRKITDFWKPIIEDYQSGKIEKYDLKPKKDLSHHKIIWQYWGQGVDAENLPDIVKICFDSVEQYKGDYTIIRLSDKTLQDYIDLPDFIWKKKEGPVFNLTFFSDILRVALLKAYGGVWIDATVLFTGVLPSSFAMFDHFVYQRNPSEEYQKQWMNSYAYYWGWRPDFKVKMLSSIFFAHRNTVLVSVLLDLLLYYWKTQDAISDYFFFQILYTELISGKYRDQKCPIISDTIPHFLQTKLSGGCEFITYEEIFNQTTIHKLTYKGMDVQKLIEVLRKGTHVEVRNLKDLYN
ncbi:capsular biosynthesis protein [Elizabethkingia argentiflava]|uniref:Capsular biosynthesis protein n=1 Tax=Elizabethkingia argenteiflava TaxID=2681556 RepID=A0A845PUK6_9FLAO|nr:capsular polysaccharide synthesis protein [Elizabethkingia argenteiflava]NAW51335.1 capsular biosynthesis protein [Elizabethkingia argenteiflava]